MATDATGTPTSPDNIPTYNTAVDAPSGKGFNAAMAAIQTALSARPSTPASIATGEAMIWNGSTFVRSSVQGLSPSGISGYPNNIAKGLRGDGTWAGETQLMYDSSDAGVSLPAASITTPTLSTNYAHLLIVYEGSSNTAGANLLSLRVNGDSGANYYGQRVVTNNAATTITTQSAATSIVAGFLGGTTNTVYRGNGIILIQNYNANFGHPITWLSGMFTGTGTSTFWNGIGSGMKGNTSAAITTLTFMDSGGANILAGSRFSVYGMGTV